MKTLIHLTVVIVFLLPQFVFACTIFLVSNSRDAVVARNRDARDGYGLAFINKRNVRKEAALVGLQPALVWTSKYMSVTFSGLGRDFTGDGMNEAGVSASILAHSEGGVVPPLSDPRPAIIRSQWIQYILDTSGSVVEAIQQAQKTRLIRNGAQVHYLVCDSSSQCVTFEYLNGNLVIHTGANLPYPVLANSTYSQSLNYFADLISHEDPYTILNNQRGNLWIVFPVLLSGLKAILPRLMSFSIHSQLYRI